MGRRTSLEGFHIGGCRLGWLPVSPPLLLVHRAFSTKIIKKSLGFLVDLKLISLKKTWRFFAKGQNELWASSGCFLGIAMWQKTSRQKSKFRLVLLIAASPTRMRPGTIGRTTWTSITVRRQWPLQGWCLRGRVVHILRGSSVCLHFCILVFVANLSKPQGSVLCMLFYNYLPNY